MPTFMLDHEPDPEPFWKCIFAGIFMAICLATLILAAVAFSGS